MTCRTHTLDIAHQAAYDALDIIDRYSDEPFDRIRFRAQIDAAYAQLAAAMNELYRFADMVDD